MTATSPPTQLPKSELAGLDPFRGQRRAQRFVKISVGLLAVSAFAVVASASPEWAQIVPFLMWVHIAIMVVGAVAIFDQRRLRNAPPMSAAIGPRDIFAKWILAAGIVAVVVAAPRWVQTRTAAITGNADSWAVSTDAGQYFVSINKGPRRTITLSDYNELNRQLHSFFARGWVAFSFILICLWHYLSLRWQDLATPKVTAREEPSALSATSAGAAAYSNKATAAIALVWVLALGQNLTRPLWLDIPSVPTLEQIPPLPVFVVALPIVLFGVGALFAKRSPFLSPWIAHLVDGRFGAGACEAFLVRLKPVLLFGVAALSSAVADWLQFGRHDADWSHFSEKSFFVSAGIAFCLSHFIMRIRKVPGV